MPSNELPAVMLDTDLVIQDEHGHFAHSMSPGRTKYIVTLVDPEDRPTTKIVVLADSEWEAIELGELAIDKTPALYDWLRVDEDTVTLWAA